MKRITALLLILLLPGIAFAKPIKISCPKEEAWMPCENNILDTQFFLDTNDLDKQGVQIDGRASYCDGTFPFEKVVMSATPMKLSITLFKDDKSELFELDRTTLILTYPGDPDFGIACQIEDMDVSERQL